MSAFMKRNGCLVFCFCLSIVLLTGCSSADLSEENQDKVAEYASEVVLKHDANYDKKRIDTEAAVTSSPEVSQSPAGRHAVAGSNTRADGSSGNGSDRGWTAAGKDSDTGSVVGRVIPIKRCVHLISVL